MNIAVLVLRVLHICGAIIWGGGAIMMEFFVVPSIVAAGEGGQQVARHLATRVRVHVFMMAVAITTILAGVLLYWRASDGFTSAWMRSGAGIGFGIGAVFGIIALIFGAIFGSTNAQLGKLSSQIQGKPTPEQLARIQMLQKRARKVSPFHVIGTILAMLFMATARYFVF
ncbi:MAG TPA: hypothetical protein VHP14_09860 [Anaerolineales bacterium]|nr:hypothetical protein [Anaerolineales bacterium]